MAAELSREELAERTETAALDYASRGWRVVPLHSVFAGVCSCGRKSCPEKSRGKHPRLLKWQNHASADQETVAQWCAQWPEMNVGIQLGESSGIIDVEFDTPEGRRSADELLKECFTPSFESGRSVHRLFRWDRTLPDVQKIMARGLEIRIGGGGAGTQTVFPPSRHYSGVEYRWLKGLSPDDVDVLPLPPQVAALLWNDPQGLGAGSGKAARSAEYWDRIGEGIAEGGRNDAAASFAGVLLRNCISLDDSGVKHVAAALAGWNQGNKPPLEASELRSVFESILGAERKRRASEGVSELMPATVPEQSAQVTPEGAGEKAAAGDKLPAKMRVVVTQSETPMARIYSARFSGAAAGYVEIAYGDLWSQAKVQRAALEQANYVMPKTSAAKWHDFLRHVSDLAEMVPAAPEATLAGLIAVKLVDALRRHTASDEGIYTLSWADVRNAVSFGEAKPPSNQHVAAFLEGVGAVRARGMSAGDRRRNWVFSKDAIGRIFALAGYDEN